MTLIIGLIVLGVLLILIEFVIPGGVLGILGGICIASAILAGFTKSAEIGISLLAFAMVTGGIGLWAWVRFFPQSRLGRQIFLDKNAKGWQGYPEAANLLGAVGVAHTDLRPSGMATIGTERVNVITQGEMIAKGEAIKVIEVKGNRIVVARPPAELHTTAALNELHAENAGGVG